jgi:CubicO group peptidase (beta-lactamase class C family)
MVRCLSYLSIFGVALFSSVFTSAVHADPVDDYIKLRMQKEHIPGLSLVVVRDRKVIKVKGYGIANLELNVPAAPNTVYQIGSLTKQFTAAAILLLVQENKVGLDDKISKYLDASPETWKDITLRHLLTHTSGLPANGILTTDKTFLADYTEAELLQSAISLPVPSLPGEKFSYSNLGYDLLALIIEKVSGKPYAEFVQERLFKPLGMTATKVNGKTAIVPNRAQGYLWENGSLRICEQISPTRFMGSASILSTALDLAQWDAALSADTLLTATSRKAMWTPMTLTNGQATDYGFGWFISEMKKHVNIHHNGAMNGFLANVSRFVDDKLTVLVLVNQSGLANTERIATGVARLYIPAIRPAQPPQQPSVVKVDPAVYAAYVGRYEYYNNVLFRLTADHGMLLGQLPWGEADDYFPLSSTSFWQAEDGVQITVIKNAAGEVTGLRVREENGSERTAPRIGPLFHSLMPTPDPDPMRTRKIEAALKAMEQGGKAVMEAPDIAPGAKKNFASNTANFGGLKSLVFLAAQDVTERGIERHEGKVGRILYYKLLTDKAARPILVYLTAEGLVTDEDVVDD